MHFPSNYVFHHCLKMKHKVIPIHQQQTMKLLFMELITELRYIY